jgi:hypothetical protein
MLLAFQAEVDVHIMSHYMLTMFVAKCCVYLLCHHLLY